MPILHTLPGAEKLLEASYSIEGVALQGDEEEEIETFNATLEAEQAMPANLLSLEGLTLESNITEQAPLKKAKVSAINPETVDRLVKEKSRNIVVPQTLQEYDRYGFDKKSNNFLYSVLDRYWEQFIKFCERVGFVETAEDIERMFPDFHSDIPKWITFWIMEKYVSTFSS